MAVVGVARAMLVWCWSEVSLQIWNASSFFNTRTLALLDFLFSTSYIIGADGDVLEELITPHMAMASRPHVIHTVYMYVMWHIHYMLSSD